MKHILLAAMALLAVGAAATLPMNVSWLVMIGGFGVFGAIVRRRRAAVAQVI